MITTRRTVLKSIAAILMAPTIRLRPEIDREALMRPFCGESCRYSLEEPFQQGSLTYCTDARRIIRAELTCPEIVGERRLPNAVRLWRNHWRNGQWIPVERPQISELLMPHYQGVDGVCPKCLGRRISLGDQYPAGDYNTFPSYDPDDNSIGDTSCEQCQGRAYYGPSEVEIGGYRFCYAMLSPMYDIPDVQIIPPRFPDEPMLFRADGFEGMVMPRFGRE